MSSSGAGQQASRLVQNAALQNAPEQDQSLTNQALDSVPQTKLQDLLLVAKNVFDNGRSLMTQEANRQLKTAAVQAQLHSHDSHAVNIGVSEVNLNESQSTGMKNPQA